MSPHICRHNTISLMHGRHDKTYRHGRIYSHNIALFNQQLARLVAQLSDLVFGYWAACTELLNGSGRCVNTTVLYYQQPGGCSLIEVATTSTHGYDYALILPAQGLLDLRKVVVVWQLFSDFRTAVWKKWRRRRAV